MSKRQLYSLLGLLILFMLDGYFIFSRLYLTFESFDIFLHFFGGFFIAMFLVEYLGLDNQRRRLKQIFILTSAVIFVGVFWEFFEFIIAYFLDSYIISYINQDFTMMGSLEDTLLDLAMDFLGAAAFATFFGSAPLPLRIGFRPYKKPSDNLGAK